MKKTQKHLWLVDVEDLNESLQVVTGSRSLRKSAPEIARVACRVSHERGIKPHINGVKYSGTLDN